MSVIEDFSVRKVEPTHTHNFIKYHHYAKRLPNICFSYSLWDNNKSKMVGVITFGFIPSPSEQEFWNKKNINLLELNRLCTIDGLPKNTLSHFVSQSLKKLKEEQPNTVVISYADIDQHHTGYIYQATSWLYSGIGSENIKSFVMNDGKVRHSRHMHLIDQSKVVETKKSIGKHRYYKFLGDKRQRKLFMKYYFERYKDLPYPKEKNENYEFGNPESDNSLDKWF